VARAGGEVAVDTDLFSYVLANDIRTVAWFNEDKEIDWAIFGSAAGDSSYKGGKT
jgi:mannan endo-1,4-beta-mannosidase